MDEANRAQVDYWNGQAGQTWVAAQERMDVMLAPLTSQALAQADPTPGERVIDIGCGCGDTAIAMARRGAAVWGLDISEPMLGRARERAVGLDGVTFTQGDASVQPFTADHQLLFSRFGVMFFADPVAAFTNLRTALDSTGRMVFMCWQAPAVNPWVSVVGRAIQPFLPEGGPADPRAPGPFAFADADYLRDLLVQAGYTSIEIASTTADLHLADDLDGAMRFQGEIGPIARALVELEGEDRTKAMAAARDALAGHLTAEGVVLGAATWLVSVAR
jgi:SAM-dependent methyltransferase